MLESHKKYKYEEKFLTILIELLLILVFLFYFKYLDFYQGDFNLYYSYRKILFW